MPSEREISAQAQLADLLIRLRSEAIIAGAAFVRRNDDGTERVQHVLDMFVAAIELAAALSSAEQARAEVPPDAGDAAIGIAVMKAVDPMPKEMLPAKEFFALSGRIAAALAATEARIRAECAEIAENMTASGTPWGHAQRIAAAIRAKGEKP